MASKAHRWSGMLVVAVLTTGCGLSAGCGVFGDRTQGDAAEAPSDEAAPKRVVYADSDRDGKVTRKEAKVDPALTAAFDQYDSNEDDELDRAEFAQLEADARGDDDDVDIDAEPNLRRFARPRNDPDRPYQ